jgi:L-threonylcarbamoyladenylate synthase
MNILDLKKTEIIKIRPVHPDRALLERAAEVIRSGGIVVYPTDTLYGFGVDAKNQVAMDRLYALKGRDKNKPVSVIVKNINHAREIVGDIYEYETNIFNRLLPGKITLILKARKRIELPRLNEFKKVAVRIPHHQICKILVEMANTPLTSTSVNLSAKGSLNDTKKIIDLFNDRVDVIIDAGSPGTSKGSTVLDLCTMPPTMVREGDVTAGQLKKILGYDVRNRYPEKYVITFVCSGNICRSPMAEGVLKNIVSESRYKNRVDVISAGTLNIKDSPPTIEAIDVAQNQDIDISKHRSRGLNEDVMRKSNLIICMALDHIHYIQEHFPQYRSKVFLLRQWQLDNKLSNPSVSDPIGRSFSFYENILNEIRMEIKRILPEIYRRIDEFIEDTSG